MASEAASRRPHLIPSVAAAILLLLALGKWPYGYYVFLRLVVCASAVFVAFKAFSWRQVWAVWVFGLVAVLFNPLVPIHLSREVWGPIDLMAAGVFTLAMFLVRRPVAKSERGDQ